MNNETALDRAPVESIVRPQTPIGWSDTDWLKHLEDKEKEYAENPFGCLHINQGSLDAMADSYAAEYDAAHGD